MNQYVPPAERGGFDWSTEAKVAILLKMSEKEYNSVVHNFTVTLVTEEQRDAYMDAGHAWGYLRLMEDVDAEVIVAFRGEAVDPVWLTAAVQAGFTENEIRDFLASNTPPPVTELKMLAALRGHNLPS
jgi:hypothetical protein